MLTPKKADDETGNVFAILVNFLQTRIDSLVPGDIAAARRPKPNMARVLDMTVINIIRCRIALPSGVSGHDACVGDNFIVSDENVRTQQLAFMQAQVALRDYPASHRIRRVRLIRAR